MGAGGNAATITEARAGDGGACSQSWIVADDGALQPAAPPGQEQRRRRQRGGLSQLLVTAFMPVGWPGTVTPDYTEYVAWSVAQAVTSYVRGVLSSHAVFRGIGVGSEAATALGAVFHFFVRDILGMAGGIVFATLAGGSFDSNAKQWRIFADVMCDVAMALDLASPLVPGGFMLFASLGSVSRAMVGMAAGATNAALTQHFTLSGHHAADVSAKNDSRERATSIVGSLVGMAITQQIADRVLVAWAVFTLLTAVHVWANVRAMRSLVLSSLNEPRAKLLHRTYTQEKDKVLTPAQVSGLESLLIPPAAALAEWAQGRRHGAIRFGSQLSAALERAAAAAGPAAGPAAAGDGGSCAAPGWERNAAGRVLRQATAAAAAASGAGSRQQHLVLLTGQRRQTVEVVLRTGADQMAQLRAYLHALHLASLLPKQASSAAPAAEEDLLRESWDWVAKSLPRFLAALQAAGWQVERPYLPRAEWTAEW